MLALRRSVTADDGNWLKARTMGGSPAMRQAKGHHVVTITRRSVLTLLATLVSWFTIRPKLHADAINGSFTEPTAPANGRSLTRELREIRPRASE